MAVDEGLLAEVRLDQERRGLLSGSITKTQRITRALMVWLDGPIFSATPGDIESYLDSCKIIPRTRYAYISHLHCFYRWAMDRGLTTEDPTAKLVRPKLRRSLPRPADSDDLRFAIEAANATMRAWLLLAALQGLRCQEIAGLEREDVQEHRQLLRVSQGKGQVERTLPLHPDVLAALRMLPMPRAGRLFNITPRLVSRRMNYHLRNLGIPATAHQLRHWFATEVYRSTHDLRLVQELLGHQSPQTTAIYTAYDRAGAHSAVDALHLT